VSERIQVSDGQVRNRRHELESVIIRLDALCGDLLRLRLAFATALLLQEFADAGVDPLAAEVVALRARLTALYDGLDFTLIEEWV